MKLTAALGKSQLEPAWERACLLRPKDEDGRTSRPGIKAEDKSAEHRTVGKEVQNLLYQLSPRISTALISA